MGDASLIVLAASQAAEGGADNFLVPNGTFFFVLAIFLIVLGVIGTFVVPPIMKVLRERDAMVAKTTADNRKAAEQFEAAQADYEKAMKEARVQASSLPRQRPGRGPQGHRRRACRCRAAGGRDVAAGRRAIEAGEGRRGTGSARQRGDHVGDPGQSNPRCRRHHLSRDEVSTMSTFIGQLIGFAAIVLLVWRYVVPPVRRLMAARQDAVRQQLDDSAKAAERLTESTTAHSKAVEAAKSEAKQVVEEAKVRRGTHRRTASGPGRSRGGAHQGTRWPPG